MAKTTLSTNFKDDVLNTSMNGKRRYKEITNNDGSISLEDVTTYDQIGDDFGQVVLNEMNRNINESFDSGKIVKDMDTLNATTAAGYVPDALLLKEVNNSLNQKINILSETISLPLNTDVSFATTKEFEKGKKYIIGLRDSGDYGITSIPIFFLENNTVGLPLFTYVYSDKYYSGYINVNSKKIYIRTLNGGTMEFTLSSIYECKTL